MINMVFDTSSTVPDVNSHSYF